MNWLLAMASPEVAQASGEAGSLWTAGALVAFLTLAVMEIVLGIDNVVFVAIVVEKLPQEQQKFGRNLGLFLALVLRVGLLLCISWIMGLTKPLFNLPEGLRDLLRLGPDFSGFTGKDLILLGGGLFLLYKATKEIFEKLEGDEHEHLAGGKKGATMRSVIFQIILLDLVFSLDSVITAVGMVRHVEIMIAAMLVAVGVMIAVAGTIQDFVSKHPSVKILALSFLNLIGVMLLLEGMHQHVNKGYIYAAMGFSLCVEILNMRYRKKQKPVELREPKPDLEDASMSG